MRDKAIEVIDYKGYQINIHNDSDPMDPVREFDQLGTMVCFHRRYNLGHKHNYNNSTDFLMELAKEGDSTVEGKIEYWENGNGWNTLRKMGHEKASKFAEDNISAIIKKSLEANYIILPLYLYDHSGITISTGPFSCPWDSGQIGYIYITKEKARKEYNWKYMTKSRIKKIIGYLEGQVETYDQYLTGDVYGYRISNEDDDHIDSCWGFFGHDHKESGLLEYAENAIDCELRQEFEAINMVNNCFAL